MLSHAHQHTTLEPDPVLYDAEPSAPVSFTLVIATRAQFTEADVRLLLRAATAPREQRVSNQQDIVVARFQFSQTYYTENAFEFTFFAKKPQQHVLIALRPANTNGSAMTLLYMYM